MKIPNRPAPSVPLNSYKKKEAPPRPPPPKFNNSRLYGTTTATNFTNYKENSNTSCASSSSRIINSTAKSKSDLIDFNDGNETYNGFKINTIPPANNIKPTIIRAQSSTNTKTKIDLLDHCEIDVDNYSPPMPTVPPPNPPKCLISERAVHDDTIPHGIALYNFDGTHADDLTIQVYDMILLRRQINNEWLYGSVGNREGMFPANFIDICVPLPSNSIEHEVKILYDFQPQVDGDLKLVAGQTVKVIKRLSKDWFYGESNGCCGQFPINFVDNTSLHL